MKSLKDFLLFQFQFFLEMNGISVPSISDSLSKMIHRMKRKFSGTTETCIASAQLEYVLARNYYKIARQNLRKGFL